MSEATPGPWRFRDRNSAVIESPDGREIAFIYDLHHRTFDEENANARLISAAPELLVSCRQAIECIRSTYSQKEKLAVIKQLEFAIAKAVG